MDRPQVTAPVVSSYSQEQTYIQAQNYIHNPAAHQTPLPLYSTPQSVMYSRSGSSATCNSGTAAYVNITPMQMPIVTASYNHQQSLHKKGSLRNGDVLKRSRVQTMYELSQDLLDKQIEMLERKYGGVKARNAALTIQRAFRRYTLLKKFAAITAMAKAEKRTSRRIANVTETESAQSVGRSIVEPDQYMSSAYIKQVDGDQACLSSLSSCRPLPVRSLSLRERRNVNNASLPRSQSGTGNMCWEGARVTTHQHIQGPTTTQQYVGSQEPSTATGSLKQVQSCSMLWTRTASSDASSSFSGTSSVNGYTHSRTSPLQHSQHSSSAISQHQHYTSYANSHTPTIGGGAAVCSAVTSACSYNSKKVPPEVPKRTSSISSRSIEPRQHRSNGLTKTTENGSLSSVQSSGSDSSISTDRVVCDATETCRFSVSPVWKRQGHGHAHGHTHVPEYTEAMSETSLGSISHTSGSAYTLEHGDQPTVISSTSSYKISETVRKRQYRVGLNLFNKKPDRGISYLIRRGFLENSPQGVARFLITRKGLSKQMIGEYLGNLQSSFNMTVLECFARELDLSGMQVDVALRKYQAYFRMPGEAQKIERLMEVFSQRYCQCNLDIVARLRSPDTVFVLAFAIIMLNTDLHTPNLKAERRMRLMDFIKNLRGIDDCGDIDSDMLAGIYERVKSNEFKPGSDHVTQVMKVQATIVGKKPNLALPHRRLVCYCRLYEIPDINKKERPGVHQREVFLFNDLLVITKILGKKKSSVTYTFRKSFPLCGMVVTLFENPYYLYGIRLSQRVDGKLLIVFNARNEHDRFKFAEDLRESICEMDEMENLRIEAELERQKSNRGNRTGTENRDSGVADVEVCPCTQNMALRSPEQSSIDDSVHETQQFKRSALSNSLLDIHEQFAGEKTGAQRRGSVGSLDSGMSVSFQSSSTSTDKYAVPSKTKVAVNQQHSFLGALFNKRERCSSGGSGTGNSNTGNVGGPTSSGGSAQRQEAAGHFVKSTDV